LCLMLVGVVCCVLCCVVFCVLCCVLCRVLCCVVVCCVMFCVGLCPSEGLGQCVVLCSVVLCCLFVEELYVKSISIFRARNEASDRDHGDQKRPSRRPVGYIQK
jgi:hypothetical protein